LFCGTQLDQTHAPDDFTEARIHSAVLLQADQQGDICAPKQRILLSISAHFSAYFVTFVTTEISSENAVYSDI